MEEWGLMVLLHDLPFQMWLLFVKVLLGRHIRLPISTFSHLSNIICEISQQVSHEFAGFREASLQILCVKSRKILWQTYFKSAEKENKIVIVIAQTIFVPLSLTRNHSASWERPQSLLLLIWPIFSGTHLPHATATAAAILVTCDQSCRCLHDARYFGAAPIVCYHSTDIWYKILRKYGILRLLLMLIRW